jgi:hypothetical protein
MWSLLASIEIDDDWILGELLLGWFCRRRYGIFPIFKDNVAILVESDGPKRKQISCHVLRNGIPLRGSATSSTESNQAPM